MDNDALDKETPLPYLRRGKDTNSTIKFTFEKETKTTKKSIVGSGDTATETTKVITAIKTKKVDLLMYSDSSEEDAESFFHVFEKFQVELKDVWDETKKSKSNDATILFDGTDKMLKESANTEWHDVINQVDSVNGLVKYPNKDWETFKKAMAEYIVMKVLTEDAYDKQKNYLQERMKPRKLTAKQWWLRIQTLNRWLIYFFKDIDDLKDEVAGATWTDWWTKGSIPTAEIRRIITTKAPQAWQNALKLHSVNQSKKLSIDTIIAYYTTLEAFESKGRSPAINGPRGRFQQRGRGRGYGGFNTNSRYGEGSYNRNNNMGRSPYNNNNNNNMNSRYGQRGFQQGFRSQQQGFNRSNRYGGNRFGGRFATPSRGPPKQVEQYAQYETMDDDIENEEQAYQAWNDIWDQEDGENNEMMQTQEEDDTDGGDVQEQEQPQEEDYYFFDQFDQHGWYGGRQY